LLIGIVAKSLLLDLTEALLIEPAAHLLPSRIAERTLRRDLAIILGRLDSNDVDVTSAIPLVEQVVDNDPTSQTWSENIWLAVFDFVARTSPNTLPTALENAILDTPLRSSSASQSGIEQTHDEVDQRILEELTGRVYYDVGGFYERYFEGKSWMDTAEEIYDKSRPRYTNNRWSRWPEPSLQIPFYEWFMDLQNSILSGLRHKYCTSANKILRGSEADRKLDIFLIPTDDVPLDGEHGWSNVLVIGEHKRNSAEDRSISTLLQLAGYAREVFGSQPDRRFVPGFTICGSVMRLWVFDRSGSYSSRKFDIHEEPERFIRVIAGYALMTDEELGLNTFIKRDENDKYIIAGEVKIYLEDKPIASQKAIVCRGTTCYRGRRGDSMEWEFVVKLAWPSDKRQQEGRLLKLAKDRGVTGIASWFNHEQIVLNGRQDTTATLRRDMRFEAPRKLPRKASWVDSTESSRTSRTRSLTSRTRSLIKTRSRSSRGRVLGLGISTATTPVSSSERKRKLEDDTHSDNSVKRSRSCDSRASVADGKAIAADSYSIEDADADSLAGVQSEAFGNRIHCCLVVSPAGRPLHAYSSVKELLVVFRDAIAGHRSLLEKGKILHRDISENNIIIVGSATEGSPKGLLIDLDLAKELDSMPSGATHRTGTMQFMAIEVLQGKGHTYRHDLESFFYVFIWMCIRYGHENAGGVKATEPNVLLPQKRVRPTETSILRDWYTGNYQQIANVKRGHMVGFEDVTVEFAPKFCVLKSLAEELRDVLFRGRDLAPFTGTYRDRSIMYDGMINAFNQAIGHLGKEERSK
jgi:hypothetical protein